MVAWIGGCCAVLVSLDGLVGVVVLACCLGWLLFYVICGGCCAVACVAVWFVG